MTPQREALKAEIGVRELHDQLSRYLRHVDAGGDVVVTMRGRRVARLSRVDDVDPLSDLRARGLVRDPQRSRRRARGRELLTADSPVSDLVSEHRR
ncbi:MAG: type II toxin-antitoxin system prevent-host-death family antitoxin [Actinomycetota bacterium]|nr:type II toxin-antitoxin system prevent-host-death family antitoxin [Actinomycetota bacterium]